ncbi:hypothetical protein KHC23_07690 [Ancylobacter dichloromethanicus]|uniref:Uncharacterized protein n=1 Tax=Ancylobacter dichloromethanicus TaxID=518825 RepID=A0A9W6J8A6_9HYPH|nr:hypothetical protein [Ancylobacter dichloromethanicus]MBS7553528.1 hypothetical protein [Ancylobacter dichloromethanicus]GLK72587.1 hypothetical protein GCM10017643_27030 [Ancylobacter dichloromethanicus]
MSAATGTDAIAAGYGDAKRRLHRRQGNVKDPARGQPMAIGDDIVPPGGWQHLAAPDGMPPGCPVQVLGMDGDVLYVIDALGQLASITDNALGQKKIQRLFLHRMPYLYWAFPRWGKPKGGGQANVDGFDTVAVADALYTAAGEKGMWNAGDRVRGLGGWTDRAGNFVYHAGEVLFINGRERATGDYDGQFYPRRPGKPEPWAREVTDDMLRNTGLLQALANFTFERKIDAIFILGWLCAAFLGAALPWRPMIFVVGDRGVGKSTLQALIKGVLGDALHATADTTPAGIYQRVGQDSLPVAVDELEAGANNDRVKGVVALARLAASGAVQFRGGSNHVGTSFTAKNCFFMSAINMPPVPSQDLSRMALIHLRPRPAGYSAKPVTVDADTVGRMVLRRLIDRWPAFEVTYQTYREALSRGGHDGRGQDTYGTLLACADLLLGDGLLEEMGMPTIDGGLDRWSQMLAPSSLPEHEDATDNWRRCLNHLLTARIDAWRGGVRHTVGQLLDDLGDGSNGAINLADANVLLAQVDLKVRDAQDVLPNQIGGKVLFIPNQGKMIAEVFKGEVWAGDGSTGSWPGALRQGLHTGVIFADKRFNRERINGIERRCTLVNLRELNFLMARERGDAEEA